MNVGRLVLAWNTLTALLAFAGGWYALAIINALFALATLALMGRRR